METQEKMKLYAENFALLKIQKKRQEDLISYLKNYRHSLNPQSDKCFDLLRLVDKIISEHSYYFLQSEPEIRYHAYNNEKL